MGKRRGKSKKMQCAPSPKGAMSPREEDVDWSDSETSVTTHMTLGTEWAMEVTTLNVYAFESALDEALPDLKEKRGTTRLKAFSNLNKLFCKKCCFDWIITNYDFLTTAICQALKRSCTNPDLASECTVASQMAGILTLSVDADTADHFFELVWPILKEGIQHNRHKAAVKSLCETLSVFLICTTNTNNADHDGVMEFLESLWTDESRPMNMRAWTLGTWYVCVACKASADNEPLLLNYCDKLWEIMELCESDVVLMRTNAAACITLFFELAANLPDNCDFNIEDETGLSLDHVCDQFRGFSSDRRTAPRKELKGQRKKFRLFLDSLEEGEVPQMKFKIRKESVCISTWAKIFQLECAKRTLRGGFQIHVIDNEFLQAKFDLENIPELLELRKTKTQDEKLEDKFEKKHNKKKWQQERDRGRNAKQNQFYNDGC